MKSIKSGLLAGLIIGFGVTNTVAEILTSTLYVQTLRVDSQLSPAPYPSGKDAVIKFTAMDGSGYCYYYNSGDLAQIAKANQYLSVLLTAKSTGTGLKAFTFTSADSPACASGVTCFDQVELQ